MKPIAKRIKEAREAKGWSGTDLAKHAGIRQSFIGAIESGAQETSGYLPEIAHALGVDAYWLKTGTEPIIGGDKSSIDGLGLLAILVGIALVTWGATLVRWRKDKGRQ